MMTGCIFAVTADSRIRFNKGKAEVNSSVIAPCNERARRGWILDCRMMRRIKE